MTISLREKIYRKIRDSIVYGKLSPGERLIESSLVKEFRASRSPIREALRQLGSEGLVKLERNKGITVTKLSIKAVDEIYTLRCLLESYATRLTAERVTKKQMVYLRGLQRKLAIASKNLELRDYLNDNTSFHSFFIEHSGNENMIQILDGLRRKIYRYQIMAIYIPGHFESYFEDHESILQACEKNDSETAEKYMRIHLERIRNVMINHLNQLESISLT